MPLPLRGEGFEFDPNKDPLHRYGTVELVQCIVRAARRVHEHFSQGVLTIGDLSRAQGGPLDGHASHQCGRDVDIRFPLLDAGNEPFPSKAIPIEPDGTGTDYRDLADGTDDVPVRLDTARLWAFVEALLAQPHARINRIYVVEHVRSILLDHARGVGADPTVVERFGHVTCQPRFPHDDHLHIRFFCTLDDIDAGCEDTLPIYPWHLRYLASHERTFRPPTPRQGKRGKVTTLQEAARRARRDHGPFHPDVTAFLERRRKWARKPHPGRPFCR